MSTTLFDPSAVAYYEVEGWKAYYDHNWLRLLRLLLRLLQVQFRIPFPQSIAAAYYVTRASAAWVPKDHQAATIEAYLCKFYQLARRYSGLKYDVERAAALELQYWEVHRRLVGQPDKTDFIDTMIQLHAVVFGLSEADARESAELRVEANNVEHDYRQNDRRSRRRLAALSSAARRLLQFDLPALRHASARLGLVPQPCLSEEPGEQHEAALHIEKQRKVNEMKNKMGVILSVIAMLALAVGATLHHRSLWF